MYVCMYDYVCMYESMNLGMYECMYVLSLRVHYRRKFRSQTSDKDGQLEKQRWEESERREAVRRSKRRKSEKKKRGRYAKREGSRDSPCFSNDLRLRRVEK